MQFLSEGWSRPLLEITGTSQNPGIHKNEMVKITNVFGDVKTGKQDKAVYQRHYGKQIRRVLKEKKNANTEVQLEQRARFKAGINFAKGLTKPERDFIKSYMAEAGITAPDGLPTTWYTYAKKIAMSVPRVVFETETGGAAFSGTYAVWYYRKPITLTNSGSELTNYQILVTLTTENFTYSKCNEDGSDLRFAQTDKTTPLTYWLEDWNYNGTSKVWVKVDSIPAGENVCLYIYYSNTNAESESNGEATFEVFDNFNVNSDANYEIKEDGSQDEFSYDETNKRISIDQIRGRDEVSAYYLKNVSQNIGWYMSMKGRLGTPSGSSYDNVLGIWLSKQKGNVPVNSPTRTDFYASMTIGTFTPSAYEKTFVGFYKDGVHTNENITQQLHDQDILFELWATSGTMKGKISVGGVTKHEKAFTHTVNLTDINYIIFGDLMGYSNYGNYTAVSTGWMDEFRVSKHAPNELTNELGAEDINEPKKLNAFTIHHPALKSYEVLDTTIKAEGLSNLETHISTRASRANLEVTANTLKIVTLADQEYLFEIL